MFMHIVEAIMIKHWISRITLGFILATVITSAHATDEALLQILLHNKLITQEQYATLQVKNAEDKGK